MQLVYLCLFVCATTIASAKSGDDEIGLDLIQHETCAGGYIPTQRDPAIRRGGGRGKREARTWKKKIEFPSLDPTGGTKLVSDRQPGCYHITGDVKVHQLLRNNVQFYVTVNSKASRNNSPMPCKDYSPRNGCGGYGSCVYCNTCEDIATSKTARGTRASLQRRGRPLKCGEKLRRGIHRDISLRFCLPTKSEFLKLLGMKEELFDKIIKSQGDGGNRHSVFITLYIFEFKASRTILRTYALEKLVRTNLNIEGSESIPRSNWEALPFYKLVAVEGRGFVGCHKVFGNLILTPV